MRPFPGGAMRQPCAAGALSGLRGDRRKAPSMANCIGAQRQQIEAMFDQFGTLPGLTLVFILAGFVKGVIGLGLPTVAMGFLTLLMPPAEAATVLILPSFATNVWQLAAGPRLVALLRRLWPMQLAATAAAILAARWLGAVNSAGALAGAGAALVLYAISNLAPMRPDVPPRHEWW